MFESRPASRMGGSSADRFAVPDTKPVYTIIHSYSYE